MLPRAETSLRQDLWLIRQPLHNIHAQADYPRPPTTRAGVDAAAPARVGCDFGRISLYPRTVEASANGLVRQTSRSHKDPYEAEADRVAHQVVRMPDPGQPHNPLRIGRAAPLPTTSLDRGQAPVQTTSMQADPAPSHAQAAVVDEVLRAPGQPLDPATRNFMEPRFGHDFSAVRVHTDSAASESAATLDARAYTSGQHVVFGAGQFQPHNPQGRWLLAHELTHVRQQAPSAGRDGAPAPSAIIQKAGPEDSVEEVPSAKEEADDRQYGESLKDWIYQQYWGLLTRIAKAQNLGQSSRRHQWMDLLTTKAHTLLEAIVTKTGPLSMWEVTPLYDLLTKIEKELAAEQATASALWERTNDRYGAERSRLQEEGDYVSELALTYLDRAFADHARLIDAQFETEALVQEDILGLVYILDHATHLQTARTVSERERADAEARLAELSEVPEKGPGFFETAWSIVGCDSAGECLGDAILTVATAGTGKAVKFVVKGGKALKKARKARKVVRSAQRLKSRLHALLKHAKSLDRFLGAVKGAAGDAASTYAKWLKKNWAKVVTKISTDLIANYSTGEGKGATTVAAARVNKEFIGTVVEKELGLEKPDPKSIEVAISFFVTKRHRVAASIVRTFILQSLKYRTAVNLAFESLRAGTPLTEADEIFRRTLTSTIAESAQDMVQAIPFVGDSDLLKYITETIRKVVQRLFG